MNQTEWTYQSSDGTHTIYATIWTPEEAPVGVVQICHGMVEHMGRYEWLAGQLCAHGYAVCGDDHLGHGRTAAAQEDLGFFGEQDGVRHLVEDEDRLRREMEGRFPGLPFFLLGHSMGSFITRNYVARYGEGLAGYICCGTSGPNPLSKFAILLAGFTVAVAGPRRPGKLLNRLAFQNYNKEFGGVAGGHEWLSRDPASYAGVDDDPKCSFIFTNAGFRDLFRLLDSVTGRKWSDRVPRQLPILLLSGDMDPVGQYGKGPGKVAGWLKASGVRDVTVKLYPGARHELHNETNKDEVIADLLGWMANHQQT